MSRSKKPCTEWVEEDEKQQRRNIHEKQNDHSGQIHDLETRLGILACKQELGMEMLFGLQKEVREIEKWIVSVSTHRTPLRIRRSVFGFR